MPPAGEGAVQRLRDLEARVAQLLEENQQLAERQVDTALLGLVSEHVYLVEDAAGILQVGLEQVSILKDVPLCAVGDLGPADVVVRHAYHARSDARLDGRVLRLAPRVVEALRSGALLLRGAQCAEAGLDAALLPALAPGSALLLPFTCRTMPRGLFLFVHEDDGAHLADVTPVLARVVETVAARLENVALLEELLALNAALDEKVASRTGQLTAANQELEDEVAERRRTEEALRQSEARLRLALSASAMASVDWDLETGRLTWSEGAATLLGAAPATLEAWVAAVHQEDRGAVAALLAAAPSGGRRTRLEHRVAAAPERWLELHASAVAGLAGRAARVTGVLVDVTERRHLEDERRQSVKLESIGRLAGGVAHDFNNLLTTILGVGELLAADLPPGGPQAADLRTILEAGRHAAALTRQLLAFSRKQQLEVHPLPLEEVCRTFAPMLARLIGEDVVVRLDLDVGAPPILGDRSQIEQVLMNLAINARDAMPRGGTLTISVAAAPVLEERPDGPPPGRWVRLSVSDTGTGMAPEVAARAFEPFFTTKARGQGTGLGLATVYGVVRQHGGHARLFTAPGAGTRFDLYLPAAEAASAAAAPSPAAPAPAPLGRGETVLVVDDEPSIRRVVRSILVRLGYQVLEAEGGAQALELVEQTGGRVDALLSDVVMPGMRGAELGRAFRARWPGRPVLLMSGYAEGLEDATAGADAFVVKPLTFDALARALRAALDQARGAPPPDEPPGR
ncbi:MAG: response regulator [Anaeromyxobacter sp.]|nr:response regulator [Anaeromyxobacter sp.]MBL0276464.1 response regulator [Anaeromyxobacter sp.]